MNRILSKALLTGAGLFALAPMFAPSDASAQSCRTSVHGGHHHRPSHRYVAPRSSVRVYVAPSRILTHSHYGGPIYYRSSPSYYYARPTHRYYRPSVRVAPRRTYSYTRTYRSYSPRRRCR